MDQDLFKKLREIRGCLAHLAVKNEDARRRHAQDKDDDGVWYGLIPPFQLDVVKASHSKSLRRTMRKTQVVSLPSNAHTRTRGIHEVEVGGTCLLLEPLGLNQQLLYAAALVHDNGQGPFGHFCEDFLSRKTGREFRHEVFGVVVAQKIERRGRGANYTHQTLDCSIRHSRGTGEMYREEAVLEEASALMYADKITYLFGDYNDMFVRGSLTGSKFDIREYPGLFKLMESFGKTQRERTYACVAQLCLESAQAGHVSFEKCAAAQRFAEARKLMYEAYGSIRWDRLEHMLSGVYELLSEVTKGVDPAVALALLTEEDVEYIYRHMTRINANMAECINATALGDVLRYLPPDLDFTNPDLGW